MERTGKTLKQWFEHLDSQGGLERGRRELVNGLYEALGKDEWWATSIAVEYEKARGQKEKDGLPKGYSICVTKAVAAPLARVYGAWADAKALDAWLGPRTVLDLTAGGRLENADGDRATFQRVRANKDLRFTWDHARRAPGSQVEVAFADKGQGKVGITLNHTRIQDRRHADELRAGWGAAFEALKSRLES